MIPLRVLPSRPDNPQPGDCWRWPHGDHEGREAWWITVPNTRDDREISWRTTDRAHDPPHEMWQVSGTPPSLTVTPSINVLFYRPDGTRDGSYWHGHITNGQLA